MARLKKRGNIILTIVLVAIIALGMFGFISLFKRVDNLETTKTVSWTAYERGILDDATGKAPATDSNSGIRLKKYINADGLTCKLTEDAAITYQVNFYDKDYKFISVKDKISDYASTENPENAKYVLIEIVPDADDEVSLLEVKKYADMLQVTYNK